MVKKKYRRMNKKKSIIIENIYKAIDDLEEIDYDIKKNRRLYIKVIHYIRYSEKKKAKVLRHVLVKGAYTTIIYLFIRLGIKITPEVKEILDLLIDLI